MTLEQELARAIEGEVRFDAVSKALYSTDASVYQIRPMGVVLPKSREDLVRIVEICGVCAALSPCAAAAPRRPASQSARG